MTATDPKVADGYRPPSQAMAQGLPDPDEFTIVNCPYCIDAREQTSGLAGCLRHIGDTA